jgi:hypothetical protein
MAVLKHVHHTKFCAPLVKDPLDALKKQFAGIGQPMIKTTIAQTILIVLLFAHHTMSIALEV